MLLSLHNHLKYFAGPVSIGCCLSPKAVPSVAGDILRGDLSYQDYAVCCWLQKVLNNNKVDTQDQTAGLPFDSLLSQCCVAPVDMSPSVVVLLQVNTTAMHQSRHSLSHCPDSN